jgi:hypothetical protein
MALYIDRIAQHGLQLLEKKALLNQNVAKFTFVYCLACKDSVILAEYSL